MAPHFRKLGLSMTRADHIAMIDPASIADRVVPEYRDGKRSYSCTGNTAKRWGAAYEAAKIANETVEKTMLARVVQLREDEPEAGFWIACSGCQESDEGYLSERLWPHSKVFDVQPGSGCTECGGLGVLWDDTDYEAFGRFIAGEDPASHTGDMSR